MLDFWCMPCGGLWVTRWHGLREKLPLLLAMNLSVEDASNCLHFRNSLIKGQPHTQFNNLLIWYYIFIIQISSKRLCHCCSNQNLQNGTLRLYNIPRWDLCYVCAIQWRLCLVHCTNPRASLMSKLNFLKLKK